MEDIPSPFFNSQDTSDKLADAIDPILKKFGIRQFFVAYSEPIDSKGTVDSWNATSNMHSDSMANYLRKCADHMQEELDEPNES